MVRHHTITLAVFAAVFVSAACTPVATIVTYDPSAVHFNSDPIVADPTAMSEQLKRLRSAVPHQDADIALASGDRRFLGVKEFSVYLPGIRGQDNTDLIVREYGLRVIAGTSPDHPELLEAAKRYAEAYNTYLVRQLKPFSQQAEPGRF